MDYKDKKDYMDYTRKKSEFAMQVRNFLSKTKSVPVCLRGKKQKSIHVEHTVGDVMIMGLCVTAIEIVMENQSGMTYMIERKHAATINVPENMVIMIALYVKRYLVKNSLIIRILI